MNTIKKLHIILSPEMDETCSLSSCGVTMEMESPQFKSDEKLADLWKMVAGVPGAELAEPGMHAEDDDGVIPLKESVEKDPTGFDKRVWRLQRETCGNVRIRYRFLPRDVSGINRCHPLFDSFQEENGVLIPGVTTLAAVPDGTYHITLSWDRSGMPEEAGCTSIRGEGEQEYVGKPEDYTFTLYLAGKYKKASDPAGKRNIYWLADELPDQDKVTAQLPGLLDEMCSFFQDEELTYSIFFRKEPFEISNSGTAFDGGFAYGYSDTMPLIMDEALNTLAHEMVHNWPQLEDIHGEGAWYAEGTAEFYSLMIPLRSGIVNARQAACWLTEKSVNYYSNPYQNLSNEEAYAKAWDDNRIQRVPYGRGLFYLAETDWLLKSESGGEKSLDDLVLQLEKKRRLGKMPKVSDWENLIEEMLGADAVEHFRKVMSGEVMIPASDAWFDGLFTFSTGTYSDVKKGTVENALIWKAKVGK